MMSVCVSQAETLKPKAVLFRQKSMTSVLAVRHKAWMVFFIGTGDGQLMKVCITSDNYQCLEYFNNTDDSMNVMLS